jgi:protoporphyrinogen oxidase
MPQRQDKPMSKVVGRPGTVAHAACEHYDAIVLGAGISGLVAASVLSDQGCRHILIADEYGHLGGNHIDWSSGDYTFDIGSFIFQDDSPLLEHFPELLPRYVPIEPAWARLNPQGMVTDYPISARDDILAAGPWEIARIFASVLYARLFQKEMRNAKDFASYWIGSHLLYRSGLESYMKRFYGIEPDQIDIQLARKRMLWISEHASLKNVFARLWKPRSQGPANRQLARPKEGFQSLYKAAAERLESKGVTLRLGARFQAIAREGTGFRFRFDNREVSAERVITTIPVQRSQELCGLPPEAKLRTITLLGLYFSFSGERGFDRSILYNFSHDGAWKRITVYSDFYGKADGREYFTAEIIADHIGGCPVRAEEDFRRHVHANGLFAGDLKLEGSQILENAYPIYSDGAEQRAAEAIRTLKEFGIESLGRQGGFNYQPTARVSTREAEAALRREAAP